MAEFKLGLGLYALMLNEDHYRFARQCGASHIVVHLVDYFAGSDLNSDDQPVGGSTGWGVAGNSTERWTLPDRVLTCWLALGPVPVSDGPLFVIEDSYKFEDLVSAMKGFDLVRGRDGRKATVVEDPRQFARERGSRLLTANFGPGDCLTFGMYTFHGAFDNHSKIGRARLSCDIRYQPASEALDPRYFGSEAERDHRCGLW